MQHAFVTGGSGFVGRNLIQALVEQGVTVTALVRSDTAEQAARDAGAANTVRGDLDSIQALEEGMNGCDTIFHSAAKVELWGDPKEFHRINVQGTQNVIDAARKTGVPKLVHVSTEAVLAGGPPIVNANETWPYPKKPAGLYPLSKGQAERAVIEANGNGLETVAVRPPLIWGKGDTSVLPQIIAAVRSGQWMWFGDGHYLHTTTHVRNVAEGLMLAAEKGRGGEIYFISDAETMDFRDFITASLEMNGIETKSKSIPYWLAALIANVTESIWTLFRIKNPPPIPRSVLFVMGQKMTVDISKAQKELGYRGKVTHEAGLAELKKN